MPISTIGSNSLNQTSDLTINGVTVGKGGGAVSSNTAVGASALSANTTGNTSTAVGSGALQNNTTGAGNTAVGQAAMQTITTANFNDAYGWVALNANTSGGSNAAFGNRSLTANTTGSNNTGIGVVALGSNTTGGQNTAVGLQALTANTTASNNTAVGYQAGYSNTTGTTNVYYGGQAGYACTTGVSNNAFGYQAGYNVTTASGNCFIGTGAGYFITTGASNSILGSYNGNQGGLDIRTSSNYIVLSDGAGNPRFYGNGSGDFLFSTSRTSPRALVDIPTSGGSAGAPLAVSRGGDGGSMVIFYSMNSTTTVIGSIGNSSNTNTTYNTSSDYRLKENIAPMTGALNAVSALKPVTWKWKSTGEDGQGFIAHELAEVVPDCVTGAKDAVDADGNPVYQGIDTSYLVATLTKAIQELKTIVDAQAAEIAELKAKVA